VLFSFKAQEVLTVRNYPPWIEDDLNALEGERERLAERKAATAEMQLRAAKAEKTPASEAARKALRETFVHSIEQEMCKRMQEDASALAWQQLGDPSLSLAAEQAYYAAKLAQALRIPPEYFDNGIVLPPPPPNLFCTQQRATKDTSNED
jgi:hypothetical protein